MSDAIVTWDSYFERSGRLTHDIRHRHMVAKARKVGVDLPRSPVIADDDAGIEVFLGYNAWHAKCPFCNGQELMREDGLFMCQSCWNSAIGRRYLRASFPEARKAIEDTVLARPIPSTRNWVHGETVADLQAQNKSHGVGEGE